MQHVLIKDKELNGWEYGMLRSFENAIVRETNATQVEIDPYTIGARYLQHFGQGMKRGKYRRYFPRQPFTLNADVAWYILMGPENYRLDLYKDWDKGCKKKIVYLYDTLPSQYPLIKRLFSDNTWDVLITSFADAVNDLEALTGRKWHCIEQAADLELFQPVAAADRVIQFSSYGRRHAALHEALVEFCAVNNLYYDYTTHDGRHPTADATELYKQYAWHLSHSAFTFSWPVELTNPVRAAHLHPVTCRWFEAAAAGTVITGKPPGNKVFTAYLPDNLVVEIPYNATRADYLKVFHGLMDRKDDYIKNAISVSRQLGDAISWNDRVKRILSLI